MWLDDYDPFPWAGKQNQVFVPEGTGQHAKGVQVFTVKRDYLIHEAVEWIEGGRAESEAAGFDVDACVETINKAMPHNPQGGQNTMTDARSLEDVIREGTLGLSYTNGAKKIQTFHVIAVEADGQVTQFIIDRDNEHKTLFQKDDRYESMEECITLFTLQPGNSKFYGSKGLGRILVNMHIMVERARNEAFNQFFIQGLLLLITDASKSNQVQLKIRNPFMCVTADAKFEQTKMQASIEEFLKLDAKITQIAEMAAGAYIPDALSQQGDVRNKTATETQIEASRENEAKIAFLARAWGQFSNQISTIQKRLCKKGADHPVCKQVYKELTEAGLDDDEISEIANVPASEVVQDLTQVQNQQIMQVAQMYTGNPSVDQPKLMRYSITAMSSPQIADDLIIPQTDQTIEAEAVRIQLMENAMMQLGDSSPVSPRDNHPVHLKVVLSEIQRAAPGIVKAPKEEVPHLLDNVSTALVHSQAHVDTWKSQGAKPEQTKPFQEAIDMADAQLKKFAKQVMVAQQQEQPEQPQEGQQQQPEEDGGQSHPMLRVLEQVNYRDMPGSVQAQVEAALGFKPATPEERAAGNATNAVEKHPDLPGKVGIEVDPSRTIASPQEIHPSRTIPLSE